MIPSIDSYANDAPPRLEPMPFHQAWIKALFQPSEDTFIRIAYGPDATFWRAALWIFLASLCGLMISIPLQLAISPDVLAPLRELVGSENSALLGALGLMACLVPFFSFIAVLGSIISIGVYQLIAQMLGGKGSFTALFNAVAAFTAPISVVSSIAASIPFVNLCVAIPLSIYGLVLSVISMASVNRFGYGKAILVILLPTLLVGVCFCLAFFAFGASLLPILGDPANWENLLTPVP